MLGLRVLLSFFLSLPLSLPLIRMILGEFSDRFAQDFSHKVLIGKSTAFGLISSLIARRPQLLVPASRTRSAEADEFSKDSPSRDSVFGFLIRFLSDTLRLGDPAK